MTDRCSVQLSDGWKMSSDVPLLRLPFETCNILKLLFFLCNYRSFEDKKQYEISSSPITFINLTVFHLDFSL